MTAAFNLPIKPLEGKRLKLVPFDPQIHADGFVRETQLHPEIFTYLPYGPFTTPEKFRVWYEVTIEHDESRIWFAIIVIQPNVPEQENTFAGIIGLLNTQPEHGVTELGFLTVFPAFQRTFVFTHAAGLLLFYLLEVAPEGLGLRRVQWQAHADNEKSINAGKRLGFALEGITRWQRVLPPGKAGHAVGSDRMPGGGESRGRHSAILSMCWDDWSEGKKEHLHQLMNRR